MNLLKKIHIKDLGNDSLKDLAEIIGISKLRELSIKCPMSHFYIPKNLEINSRKEYCREHFNGGNHKELADKMGITVRSVYRILKD